MSMPRHTLESVVGDMIYAISAEERAALMEELRLLRGLPVAVRRSTGGVALHERIADPDTGMLGPIAAILADLDRVAK